MSLPRLSFSHEWSDLSSFPHPHPPRSTVCVACSSLVGNVKDGVPSSLIVTSCMTPPQAYWIRYAQTEVIEVRLFAVYSTIVNTCLLFQRNCDPRFFTTVVFYKGSVSMATQLKFEVFDVYDRRESQMCPIGQCQCLVQELVQARNQQKRLEILFDGAVCGYLTAHVMQVTLGRGQCVLCVYKRKHVKCMQIRCSLYNSIIVVS